MQAQAAPPRFCGFYPHELAIPEWYLPRDAFFRHALDLCMTPSHQWIVTKFKKHKIGYSLNALPEDGPSGKLRYQDGQIKGHFPKLILMVQDPEIISLAGGPGLPNFDQIDCKDITCDCPKKPRYEQLFTVNTSADRDSILYNNCKRTIFAAAKRQMKSAPVPSKEVAEDFLVFAINKVNELVGDQLNQFGYSFNQWYNHLTLSKQKNMDRIHEYLYGVDPTVEHYSSVADAAKYLHYEAICKVEIQAVDGKPRMVCKIPDLVKYVMGPVCWKLEEIFQDFIPSYCGGMNLTEMSAKINRYIDEGFCVVAEGDGSAFDNTQDVKLKAIDRYVYNRIGDAVYHVPKDLFLHVANQYYKIMDVIHAAAGKRDIMMTYAVLGTVFSGDCDTTLMNTLRMGLYNWFTNERAGLQFHVDFICFAKGDDFTVMYHIKLGKFNVMDAYRKYWLAKAKPNGPLGDLDQRVFGLGQILKFIEVGPPDTIKFCSLRAWYTDLLTQHIFLTRDPAKFFTLSKYSRKTLHMTNAQIAAYLSDQATALRSSYSGIEYLERMAQCYDRLAVVYSEMAGDVKHTYCGRDRRQTRPLEVSEALGCFDYTPRHGEYKISGTYWETMQRIERAHTDTLTPSECALVNAQINAEFYDRDLTWLMA